MKNKENKIAEIFGYSTKGEAPNVGWVEILSNQICPYTRNNKKCYKTRKSNPEISIGTCSVLYGNPLKPIIICPNRLTEKKQIFVDCIPLLTSHETGNELHIIPEVSIPGGHVDFVLASVKDKIVKDFVGIELQALDTTGSVWSERQSFIKNLRLPTINDEEIANDKSFGINWKMTAKTILVQMHHKVQTFEHVNKKIVLVIQDSLLNYMQKEFKFSHLTSANMGDSVHFHSYLIKSNEEKLFNLAFDRKLSTDSNGIAECLGLQAEAKIDLQHILEIIQSKLSRDTLFSPFKF